ncbi:MAG: repressor LexA [Oscillospiraceae bacterium]|nr:repressor LexA [Oscillospiraceae bacterium]
MRHKDAELMRHIREYAEQFYLENGRSPSTAEIGAVVGVHKVTVHRYLQEMRDRGMIGYDGRSVTTRKTSLSQSGMTTASVFYGAIPCGAPETVEAAIDQYVNLPTALFGGGNLYVIYARGDSMIEAGIDDGDMIIVDADKRPSIGDKVVALDGEKQSTLKTLRYDEARSRYYLHPENHLLEDIYVDELTVQGVVRFIVKAG